MSVDYPGAIDMIITDPAWVFTDALVNIASSDLTIILHKTACNAECTALDVARFFQNDTTGHRSAHFIVGRDGSVVQCVLLKDGAGANCCLQTGFDPYWTQQGFTLNADSTTTPNANIRTISIEHEDWSVDNSQAMTPQQIQASFTLVNWLVQRYQLPTSHIQGHNSMRPIDRARCPGPTYPMQQLLQHLGGQVQMNYQRIAFEMEWTSLVPNAMVNSGIANAAWADYQQGIFHGPPLKAEVSGHDWQGNPIVIQYLAGGRYEWDGTAHFHPYH
jgi:hypothetical protein